MRVFYLRHINPTMRKKKKKKVLSRCARKQLMDVMFVGVAAEVNHLAAAGTRANPLLCSSCACHSHTAEPQSRLLVVSQQRHMSTCLLCSACCYAPLRSLWFIDLWVISASCQSKLGGQSQTCGALLLLCCLRIH